MSEGLSQEDFRRLMATPRRPNNDESSQQQSKFKIPAPKTPRNTGSVFAKPESVRRKNRFKKPIKKQGEEGEEEEEEEEEESVSQYRDRAAERRKQENDEDDDSQLTTEELLQRTRAEKGEELDAKQLYTQSKYLGGDVQHTHLVKGLDFALLKQVRTDLENKKQDESDEEEEEEAMDVDEAEEMEEEMKPVFHTLLAKNIVDLVEKQDSTLRNELFEPGRMAFAFEMADEVGHFSDPFAIPTAVIRSKGEIISRLSKSGWSEDAQSESSLVIDKITQVMASVRRGDRGIPQQQQTIKKEQPKKMKVEPVIAVTDDGFMGDIFEDVGRDYELEENTESTMAAASSSKGNYFQGLVKEDDQEDQEMETVTDEAVTALLAKASKANVESESASTGDEQQQPESKKRKYNVPVDADAADIDMFGLSTSALPTSFEDHHQTNTTAYQSDDDDEEEKDKGTQFVDQGTHRNKKAQLTRWDFDNEEDYQKYKDSVEIHPKSAFQFGVKLGDGRKRNRERKGMNEKQRLNRDYQQVKNLMEKKYGQNL
ncbi:hypothetical protein K501DRAFT_228573 [Backusella circina FSU 941]|nr:hypothetical protein K501DRAFT_228573 [Backusella circina FSU 941]